MSKSSGKPANKWMKELSALDGAVNKEYNPFLRENIIRSDSPSLNWIFGKGSGIPRGYSAVFFGEPKAGKSLISNLFAGALHKQDPEAMVIKFNTEMREEGQMADYWGIDSDRYIAYNVNKAEDIFDRIVKDINDMCNDGMPLKMIIIDSLQGIQGMREAQADSVTNQQIGDSALTIQKGLKAILPILRKHRISFIATSHVRANLDAGMYGPKMKMAGAWAQKHFFEYFVEVKRDNSKDGKMDVLGKSFENEGVKDFKGNKERTGHKIYVTMAESSTGVAGRSGEFTLNYTEGLINIEEEVFNIAKNLGLVEQPNNRTYVVDGKSFTSKADFYNALKSDPEMAAQIVEKAYARDMK
jgi:RecA/RadA recombinase